MTENRTRIHLRSCHAMTLSMTVILTALMLCAKSLAEAKYGYIVGEPSESINLETTKTYSVFCVITNVPPGVNSTHMALRTTKSTIETEILNDTTIVARDLKPDTLCTVGFICEINNVRKNKTEGVEYKGFHFGRPPHVIPPSKILCISEEQRYVHCSFNIETECNMATNSSLRVVSANGISECKSWNHIHIVHWDSRNGSCVLSMHDVKTTLEVNLSNTFGNRTSQFNIVHDDIVRPGKPESLSATKVEATSAYVTWNMLELNVSRLFRYEFQLISEFCENNVTTMFKEYRKMVFSYLLENLIPFTHYTMKIRVMVKPEKFRHHDDLYWSEYGSVSFKTSAQRPITAPTVPPGSYKRSTDDMIVSIFWESIPEHLFNGTGFGYSVKAFCGNHSSTQRVNDPTYTFNNLPLRHCHIRISSYNDEGESDNFSEMQIFAPMNNRQPQLHSVIKDRGYNVSWIAPENTNLSSYTLLYCDYTSQGTCQQMIRSATIPPDRTFFAIAGSSPLNFAISANYADNYSSELSWQQCVVEPRTSRLGNPKFLIESVTTDSMVVRMVSKCDEYSYYERMQVCFRAMDDQDVLCKKNVDHYVEKVPLDGLKSGTEYEVIVSVFDSIGNPTEEKHKMRTKSSGIWILVVIMIMLGVVVLLIIATVVFRELGRLLDIHVDLPNGLLKDQEDPVNDSNSEADDYEINPDMNCLVILEEPEIIAEETVRNEQQIPPEFLTTTTTTEPQIIEGGGTYIEMTSSIRSSNADGPPTTSEDGNGNYEQMHPSDKRSEIVVQSTGYVKIDLFMNRARTGNYTQTIV